MNKKLSVSVIVPVYNGGKFLPSCLDAIFASDYSAYEAIVIDDGSTDSSAEIAVVKGATVLFTAHRQSGPAVARNLGTRKANGDILLFVDADVVIKPDTIAKIAARFYEQPEISALFGSYDDEPGEKNFLSQYRNLLHHWVHQNSNSEASTFWAGLGAVRHEVFLAVGGFDGERFPIPSIEDIEFGMRLRAKGYRILLDKKIQAKHLKKWNAVSVLRTDIFCRAFPWSKLMLSKQGLINDLNLKTSDRLSAMLVALLLLFFPFVFWKPLFFLPLFITALSAVFILNRKTFLFFLSKKGILIATAAFAWQLLYFFYSGSAFVYCWSVSRLSQIVGLKKGDEINETRYIN